MPDTLNNKIYVCPHCKKECTTEYEYNLCTTLPVYTSHAKIGDSVFTTFTGKHMRVIDTRIIQPQPGIKQRYWHTTMIITKPKFDTIYDNAINLFYDEYINYFFLSDELVSLSYIRKNKKTS